jgi:SAM-dependent methyltransferase
MKGACIRIFVAKAEGPKFLTKSSGSNVRHRLLLWVTNASSLIAWHQPMVAPRWVRSLRRDRTIKRKRHTEEQIMWCCPNCRAPAVFRDPRQPWPSDWMCELCSFMVPHRDGIPYFAPIPTDIAAGFDRELFHRLAKVEQSNFWFVNRARLIAALIRKHFPKGGHLLEIGCGTGSVLLALRDAFPHLVLAGSEVHPEGLAFARGRLGREVVLLQMDARRIPAVGEFDIIGAFDVVEHIVEDEQVLSEIYAALKPGGGAIITVPQHPWLWSPADDAAIHQRRYGRGELEAKVQKAGFRVRDSTSFNALLLPLMIASRLVMKLRSSRGLEIDPLQELQVAGWSNRVLSALLGLEVRSTLAGFRWPVGGSRFVVAQRR